MVITDFPDSSGTLNLQWEGLSPLHHWNGYNNNTIIIITKNEIKQQSFCNTFHNIANDQPD